MVGCIAEMMARVRGCRPECQAWWPIGRQENRKGFAGARFYSYLIAQPQSLLKGASGSFPPSILLSLLVASIEFPDYSP
jgi:hypothetical protein